MQPGTDKLLAKAERALATAEAALAGGAADVAAARAFAALLNAAKARLNEHGQRWHTHARVAAAYAVLPPAAAAPATWLGDALALRARLAADPDGLDYAAVEVLVDRARRFVDATRAVCP